MSQMDEERLAQLRLARSTHVGPVAFAALMGRYGTAQAAIDAVSHGAAARFSRIELAPADRIDRECDKASKFGAEFLFLGDPAYPPHLAMVAKAPPVLTVLGAPDCLLRDAVAIVGARNASMAGMRLTRSLAGALGAAGLAIVSGLARGIDTAAHQASLDTGAVGVFAGGLDRPYPPENKPLMRQIIDRGGCLVSMMPFGWEPRAVDFPRRNRLVAGLAKGLLVVEAAVRSGSLISARLAGELNRPVFAVPGSPLDARAAGPNLLIKQGATLVTEAADILQRLGVAAHTPAGDDGFFGHEGAGPASRVMEALGTVPATIDELIAHTGCGSPTVQMALMELDIAGRLQRHADGRVSLCG